MFYFRAEKILGFKREEALNHYLGGLKQQWGITNEAGAKEALTDLLNLNRSKQFELVLLEPTDEIATIQSKIAKGLGIDISVVQQVKTAYAWDICRVFSLAKWSYWIGYIKEDECWTTMKAAADIAVKHGKDWQEYTISFLLGRTIQGFDLDDIIVESKQLYHSKGPSLKEVEDIDVFKKYDFKG